MLSCAALWCNIQMDDMLQAAILCIGKKEKKKRKRGKESYFFQTEFCPECTLYPVAALVYQGKLRSKI